MPNTQKRLRSAIFALVLISIAAFLVACSSGSSSSGGGGGTLGKTLYVSNNASGTISGFSVSDSGVLTAITGSPFAEPSSEPFWLAFANNTLYYNSSVPSGLGGIAVPSSGVLPSIVTLPTGRSIAIAAVPDGSAVVFTDITSAKVETFHMSNGVLGAFGAAVQTGTNPSSVAVTPDSKNVYVVDNSNSEVWAYTYSSSDGSLTQNGSPLALVAPGGVTTIGAHRATIDSGGKYLFVSATCGYVFVFNIAADGTLSSAGPATAVAVGDQLGGIAVDQAVQYLYVTDLSTGEIDGFTIGGGGTLTPIAGLPLKTGTNSTASPLGIVIDSGSKFLFVANRNENTVAGFTIGAGGALTAMTTPTTTVGTTPIDVVLTQ